MTAGEFPHRHLLGMAELAKEEILHLLDRAHAFAEISEREIKKIPSLRGKTILNLFFENSTRTRTSFEIAGKRLSADVINLSASSSSVAKGESLVDTIKTLEAMRPDVVVVRHGESGVPALLARKTSVSIVNAGDGCHEHPTQALLDLYTLSRHVSGFKGLKVAIVGDIAHSRVARSNMIALKKVGAEVTVIGPKTLIPAEVERYGVSVFHELKAGLVGQDAVMMLRVQKERGSLGGFPSVREYARHYGLNRAVLEGFKKPPLILHPGPINRGVEIAGEVADSEFSLITEQVASGIAVRMAVLYALANRGPEGVAE